MTRSEALAVYNDRAAKFRDTRSIQWKVNLSIWTLLALAIHEHELMESFVGDLHWVWISVVLVLPPITVHWLFCSEIQWSLDSDKVVTRSIAEDLNKIPYLDDIPVDILKEPGKDDRFTKWIWLQLAITTLIALVLILAVSFG